MNAIDWDWRTYPPAAARQGVVSIGNFDGVHRGHQALVQAAKQLAQTLRAPTVVLTFDPPPLAILDPTRIAPPLTTRSDRVASLRTAGADEVLVVATEPDLLALSAEAFFEHILRDRLAVRGVVEGANFRFGHQRQGDTALLNARCQSFGILFQEIRPQEEAGLIISSSRIRQALAQGQVGLAAQLLGRPYHLQGIVVHGQERGRSLGIPTANLAQLATLLPAHGVYAGRVYLGKHGYRAAVNIGPNPTFAEDEAKVEVHLLGFQGDLYGQILQVELLEFLRTIRPFAGPKQLLDQIQADLARAAQLPLPPPPPDAS